MAGIVASLHPYMPGDQFLRAPYASQVVADASTSNTELSLTVTQPSVLRIVAEEAAYVAIGKGSPDAGAEPRTKVLNTDAYHCMINEGEDVAVKAIA